MDAIKRRIGYARVSTEDQHLDLQINALLISDVQKQNIFADKASGKNANREQLVKCLSQLNYGDTLVVWRLDRLGRSLSDLVRIVTDLEAKGVTFESINEKIDSSTATGKLVFHLFAALAEFERNLIRERTIAGLVAAKKRGRIGGRKPKLTQKQIIEVIDLINSKKLPVTKIAEQYKVSRSTIYNILSKNRVKSIKN